MIFYIFKLCTPDEALNIALVWCILTARKQRIYAAFLFIEITLPSGASVRKDVWVQVPPSALTKTVMLRENRGVLRFLL